MHTSHGNSCFFLLVFALIAGAPVAAQPSKVEQRLDVVEVRVLSDSESAARSPDFIGPNIAVRLRLSTESRGVWIYSLENAVVPAGYCIEQTELGVVWLFGNSGMGRRESSPGLENALFGATGGWILVRPFSAIEWEVLDSTKFASKKHAFSVFLKEGAREKPKEVTSEWFVVPTDNGKRGRSGTAP